MTPMASLTPASVPPRRWFPSPAGNVHRLLPVHTPYLAALGAAAPHLHPEAESTRISGNERLREQYERRSGRRGFAYEPHRFLYRGGAVEWNRTRLNDRHRYGGFIVIHSDFLPSHRCCARGDPAVHALYPHHPGHPGFRQKRQASGNSKNSDSRVFSFRAPEFRLCALCVLCENP